MQSGQCDQDSSPRKKPFKSCAHRNNLGSRVNWTLVHLQGANGSLRPEFKDKLTLHPIGVASSTDEAGEGRKEKTVNGEYRAGRCTNGRAGRE
ncbi:hypothetical protein NNRS527_00642 [Nitrosospira sp. NRS527]|nr:hypothetical protein NNRS527_00642 [Nitrosospira sp. NRS527]